MVNEPSVFEQPKFYGNCISIPFKSKIQIVELCSIDTCLLLYFYFPKDQKKRFFVDLILVVSVKVKKILYHVYCAVLNYNEV